MAGACEMMLPPGPLRLQITKGIHYLPIDETIDIPVGKMSRRFTLCPAGPPIKPHNFLVDTRCHFLSPHDAALDAAAEGIDFTNLLVEPHQKLGGDGKPYIEVSNLTSFSGQSAALEQHGASVIVNTHNRHPILGSLGLLHSHRPVFPLTFGGADASDDWSLREWSQQCHRKKGLVVWTDPFAPGKWAGGEALALAVLGEVDAFELTPNNFAAALPAWYRLHNAGVQLPIIGASGRVDNRRPLGALRTFVWQKEWVDWLKLGCKVTNGPIVNVIIDGNQVDASAIGIAPFGKLDLIINGKVTASVDSEMTESMFCANLRCSVEGPVWVAARVLDTRKSHLDDATPIFAHTNPQRLGEPRIDPDARDWVRELLNKSREWVETEGRFDDPKSKTHLLETFDEALSRLAFKR